jgi:predicted neuraminidase
VSRIDAGGLTRRRPARGLVCRAKEGSGDTAIWLARREKGRWHSPQRTVACDGLAHWNPVLFNAPDGLWLFYKVGSGVHVWKTRYVKSTDGGVSWSEPAELVNGDAAARTGQK